jgi:hypothetical protein
MNGPEITLAAKDYETAALTKVVGQFSVEGVTKKDPDLSDPLAAAIAGLPDDAHRKGVLAAIHQDYLTPAPKAKKGGE